MLILAEQRGVACHTGEHTCFHRSLDGSPLQPAVYETLSRLYDLIEGRKRLMPPGSYATSLFEKGTDAILTKVDEESSELIAAVRGGGKEEIVYETADLFYHLEVLMADSGVTFTEVLEELLGRWK